MNLQEKIDYARLRSKGASLFEQDDEEANKWRVALTELEEQLKKIMEQKCTYPSTSL